MTLPPMARSNALSGAWPRLSDGDDDSWRAGSINVMLYFPHHRAPESDASPVPSPQDRKPYHTHRGGNFELIVLDSGHYCRTPNSCLEENDQTAWLQKTLTATEAPVRLVTYHVPLFPMVGNWNSEEADPRWHDKHKKEEAGRQAFVPLFDQHHVTAAFENHLHSAKRTVPLRAGAGVADGSTETGTVYFGDGNWGISYAPEDGNNGMTAMAAVRERELPMVEASDHIDLLAYYDVSFHVWVGRLGGRWANFSAVSDMGHTLDASAIEVPESL